MQNLRHYGKFRNEEVIVLGYKPSMNACMICRVTMLPVDEQTGLRQIASSVYAQGRDYLIPILQGERHRSNVDWFTYLASKMYRNDGSVISIPLKEVTDLEDKQKAFFKGYGESIEGKPVTNPAATVNPNLPNPEVEGGTVLATHGDPTRLGVPAPANVDIASALASLAASQEKMADSLSSLVKKVKAPPARKKAAKKVAASKSV